jgi:hypothetical protein
MRALIGRVLVQIFAGLIVGGVVGAAPAAADTRTETIVSEQRTQLSLRIAPDVAQALLPADWTLSAGPAAPNLSITFMDRKLALGPDGKPLQSGTNRLLVMSVGAKNLQTGETRAMIVGGYSADPAGVPGAYGVYSAGSLDVVRTERIKGMQADTVEERWMVKGADGGVLDVTVSFKRGVPTLVPFELKIYSAADPTFYRMYRGRQASDVLRNPSAGVDRVQAVEIQASGGKLGKIFGGDVQVLGVSNAPFYTRETFLP